MDPHDNNEDTEARVAYALRGVLNDGDRFVVSCKDGVVDVDPPSESGDDEALAKTEPELYGHMLALNQELSSAGTGITLFFLVGSIVLSMAIGLGWLEKLGVPTESLQSWWVYVLLIILGFMIGGALADGKSRDVFARAFSGLMSMSGRAGFTRYTLLARIKDDKELSELTKYLSKEGAERGDR